jgi:heme/copper-type cytochrome/quinol oxidase subunit 2
MAGTTPVLAAGCAGPLSTLDPAGPHALGVARLWWVMLAGGTMLAALVFVLLALAFRRRRDGAPVNPRTWIGGLGLVMPVAVLGALLVYALVTGAALLPTASPDAVRIEAQARRYGWRFQVQGGPVSDGTLHMPAGRPVDLVITSTDVIHSLWIPRLAGKMDAIPGHTNVLRVIADRPGAYRGECAEYCGTGHRDHGFAVVAHDAAGWADFIGGGR